MTALFDLDAEMSAGVEPALRKVDESSREAASGSVAKALAEGANVPPPKAVALLKRAMKIVDASKIDAAKAAKLCLNALDLAPENSLVNHALAVCLERMGRLSKSLEFYERAWRFNPKDGEVYLNLAMVAWKLDMLDGAEKFLRLFMQLDPVSAAGPINLGGVLRDQGKFADSIELLRTAIYAAPDNPELWNSLGTTLLESGDPDQALTFYQEAMRLNPDFARAKHNSAFAYELLGRPADAAGFFVEALKNPASERDRVTMTHGLSHAYLAMGELEKGWDLYDIRLDPLFSSATHFVIDAPMWDGADPSQLKGKTVLMVGEQGLGDEILFLQLAKDMHEAIGPDGELWIAVERRLMGLVQRSLPDAVVGSHRTIQREGENLRAVTDFPGDRWIDFWTPMAQPARAFRRRVEDFPPSHLLKADADGVAAWRTRLDALGPELKVGLLWRSLKMDAKRTKHFSPFEAWAPVLKVDGVRFVNLQYGDASADLAEAKRRYGVDIHQPEGIDLKNDLDDVVSLTQACDLVMGPSNATTNLTAAAGGEVWLVHPYGSLWSHMGVGQSPWYPTSHSYFCEGNGQWGPVMKAVAADLENRVRTRRAA